MARHDWLIDVIDDLGRFSEQENLKNLEQIIPLVRNAVEMDIHNLEEVEERLRRISAK